MFNQTVELDSIALKIYDIVKMNLRLSKDRNKEILSKLYDYALRVDSILTKDYKEGLTAKYYKPKTLEEEIKRLEDLIKYIKKRDEERKNFIYEYLSVSKQKDIELEEIEEIKDLDKYQTKINNIKEYLNIVINIQKLNVEDEKLTEEIKVQQEEKENSELIDVKLEDEILNKFITIISRLDYYKNINADNINKELFKIEQELAPKQKNLDVFNLSVESLANAGITIREENEYRDYIKVIGEDYFKVKEKGIILNIYKLLLKKENEYIRIYSKREKLDELLIGLIILRNDFDIKTNNPILDIYSLASEQLTVIKLQKETMDKIYNQMYRIKENENNVNDMKERIQSEEILTILKEFEIIDIYDTGKIFEQALNEVVRTKDVYKMDLAKVRQSTYKVLLILAKTLNIEVKEIKEVLEAKKNKNIGSVHPTNVLKAIEESNLKLPDLILPSMGLSNDSESIKINGEEYVKSNIDFNTNTKIFND